MQEQETYTIRELFYDLPMPIRQLAQEVGINEVTLARIRDGKPTHSYTANKLLVFLSRLYGRQLSLRNVTGINVQERKRGGKKEQKQAEQEAA